MITTFLVVAGALGGVAIGFIRRFGLAMAVAVSIMVAAGAALYPFDPKFEQLQAQAQSSWLLFIVVFAGSAAVGALAGYFTREWYDDTHGK